MRKKQELYKTKAKESKERAAKLREEANKLVAESIKAKENAQKSSFELIKKAKEATEAASQAEEEVNKMEADSQKCCGCTDQNCGPHKNIKQEIKVLDQTIEKQRSLWSMVRIIKKQVIESRSAQKRIQNQLNEIMNEREQLQVQWEKEKSDVIKESLAQKIRIEEAVKLTLIEAKAQTEKLETTEGAKLKEIKEKEISLIKQKEELKKSFEKQINSTKKECSTCDKGVQELVKNREQLDRIKKMEDASGGFLPKSEKPLSKDELMDAMRAIMTKRQEKKAAKDQLNKETEQVIVEKQLERQLERQNSQITTMKYQIKKSQEITQARKEEKSRTEEFVKTQEALRAIQEFEEK